MITVLQLIKENLKASREVFEGTISDLNEEQIHKEPGGKALKIAAIYAHLVFSEDVLINSLMRGKTPLYKEAWKDKTGTNIPMPEMDENWSENNINWAKKLKLTLPLFREYAKAVFTETDTYIDSLSEDDVSNEIDLGSWGKQNVATMFSSYIIAHINSLTGEISALKGIQGLKGYPF